MELHEEAQEEQKQEEAQNQPGQVPKAAKPAGTKERSYSFSHRLLYFILAGVLIVVGIVATLLCRAQVMYTEQEIIADHRDIEQAWVETTLETIRSWQSKSLEGIRYVSQAEMFRLFAKDYQDAALRLGDRGQGNDDLRAMGEELDYLRDLLNDTVKRRGWYAARIVSAEGRDLVTREGASPLNTERLELVGKAQKERSVVYSSLYAEGERLLIDVVDPLYEVMSMDEPKIVGHLLVTLDMAGPVGDFLLETHLKDASYRPQLLTQGANQAALVMMKDGKPVIVDHVGGLPSQLPFERRGSFGQELEVYSEGAHLSLPPWYAVIELGADIVDQEIRDAAREIYGLGVLGSLALALFCTMVVGTWIVRHKAKEEQRCIGGLVHAIECALDGSDAKFRYLQGRSHKVANLSARLGKQLKLSSQSMEQMQLAARLSQVGKIFVPRDIMVKRGLLTDEERRQVQLAPYHAYNVLKGVLPGKVARIVYQMGGKVVDDPETGANHELTVKEMLLEARVLLVANDFCAMVSQRGNRPPLPMSDARRKLGERDLYDKNVVAAINLLNDDEIKTLLETPMDQPV